VLSGGCLVTPVDRRQLPEVGLERPPRLPDIHKRRLANGPEVWSIEHRGVPVITLHVLMANGAAADPPSRPGLAAMTADLLDESAGGSTALELHERIARIGARFDIEVGSDATVVTFTCLRRHLDAAADVLADMVVRPRFAEQDVARVRQLRLNRIAQLRDHPSAVAERLFASVLYPDDAYGHVPAGTTGAIAAIDRGELAAFYANAWRPDRAILIGTGDTSESELFDTFARRFASWGTAAAGAVASVAPDGCGGSAADSRQPRADSSFRPISAIVDRPGAAQSEIRIGRVAAPRVTPDYHALLVLNMVLGGQFTSRLNMNLREAKGLTYGARTAFDFRKRPGPFSAQTSVQTDATAVAIREIFAEFEALRGARPPADDELSRARAGLAGGYARNFETAEQIGRAALQLALYDLPDSDLVTFVDRIRAVDRAAIAAAAEAYLDPACFATVIVGDYERIRDSLEPIGLGGIAVHDANTLF
jgi:predicted Zn-dependent peptidase